MSILIKGLDMPKEALSVTIEWWDENDQQIRFDDIEANEIVDRVIEIPKAKDIYYTVNRHCEFKCSHCGEEIIEVWSEQEFNYCPFCGAEIESEE